MLVMVRIYIFKNIFYLLLVAYIFAPQFASALDIVVDSSVSISAEVRTSTGNPVNNKSGSLVNLPTVINFSGMAYPLSRVYILKDGQIVATTVADQSSHFSVSILGLSTNVYTFSVYSEDSNNRKSSFFSFPIFITSGTIVNIGNIFLSPTIDVDKIEVKKGNSLIIFGQSIPGKEVIISVFSDQEYLYKVISNTMGVYSYYLFLDLVNIRLNQKLL